MGVHNDWSRTSEFDALPQSPSSAREFVTLHLHEYGLGHLVDDVRLVVSELATNAMVHAHTPFAVSLRAGEESVRLEVIDGSPSEPILVSACHLDTEGRGVAIVEALSRQWGVTQLSPGGKTVWAEFDKLPA